MTSVTAMTHHAGYGLYPSSSTLGLADAGKECHVGISEQGPSYALSVSLAADVDNSIPYGHRTIPALISPYPTRSPRRRQVASVHRALERTEGSWLGQS